MMLQPRFVIALMKFQDIRSPCSSSVLFISTHMVCFSIRIRLQALFLLFCTIICCRCFHLLFRALRVAYFSDKVNYKKFEYSSIHLFLFWLESNPRLFLHHFFSRGFKAAYISCLRLITRNLYSVRLKSAMNEEWRPSAILLESPGSLKLALDNDGRNNKINNVVDAQEQILLFKQPWHWDGPFLLFSVSVGCKNKSMPHLFYSMFFVLLPHCCIIMHLFSAYNSSIYVHMHINIILLPLLCFYDSV